MSDIIIYETGKHQVDVRMEGETLWLSLQQLADLFERDKSVISRHLKNIFDSRELDRDRTVAKNATVQMEGEREVIRQIENYNLDAIISVGYRVNSVKATRFRQWATSVLREHLTKGYTVNEKRLAQKQQEIQQLKDGIRILSRAIEEKAGDTDLNGLNFTPEVCACWMITTRKNLMSKVIPGQQLHILPLKSISPLLSRCARILVRQFSDRRRDQDLGVPLSISARDSAIRTCIRLLRKKPRPCFISLSKITPLLTATSALQQQVFFCFCKKTIA